MAAAPDLSIYPFIDENGNCIPLDIVRYLGLIKQTFGAAAVNNVVIPVCDFLILWADQDCYIQLNGNAVIPADGVHSTDLIFLPAKTFEVVFHKAFLKFGVIRSTVDGILEVQTCLKWKSTYSINRYGRQ